MFEDLREFKPSVWRGLQDLLEYEGADMEEVFLQPFQASYTDLFGATVTADLRAGGGEVTVGQANKREFVDLYADFLLNSCVEAHFLAFQRGFDLVTSESPLNMMFTPQELEMLICGEKVAAGSTNLTSSHSPPSLSPHSPTNPPPPFHHSPLHVHHPGVRFQRVGEFYRV